MIEEDYACWMNWCFRRKDDNSNEDEKSKNNKISMQHITVEISDEN